jgi:cytochrome b6-f complex iron-sulfur subunit
VLIVCRIGLESADTARIEERLHGAGGEYRWTRRGKRVAILVSRLRSDDVEAAALLDDPAIEYVLRNPSEEEVARIFSRRSMLNLAIGSTGLVSAAMLGIPLGFYLSSPTGQRSLRGEVFVGRLDQIPINGARTQFVNGEEVIFVRRAEDEVLGFSATCTHSDTCLVDWDAQRRQLVCPCHRGIFDIRGNVVSGPPPRPLGQRAVVIRDGKVFVRGTRT